MLVTIRFFCTMWNM